MNIIGRALLLAFITTASSTVLPNQSEANHRYLLPLTFDQPETHRFLATRDVYESTSLAQTFTHTHSLRIIEHHFKRASGDWSHRDIQKTTPTLISQNRIQLQRSSHNQFHINLLIWDDLNKYALEKTFQVHFKEGSFAQYLQGKHFTLELSPVDQLSFHQMMKTRFMIELSHYLEKKRIKLRSKDLYIKSYEFKNFSARGKVQIIGSAEGLVIVHPDYEYELDLKITRLSAHGIRAQIPSITLPQDFSPIQEIDLKH